MATHNNDWNVAAVKTTNQEITDGMINVETDGKRMVIAEALNAEMRSTRITGIRIAVQRPTQNMYTGSSGLPASL